MRAEVEKSPYPLVLVIEDEPSQLESLSEILEHENLTPICCATGAEALHACIHYEVHVAILDLHLSDIDGLELLEQLLSHRRDLKVIIHTGYASLDNAVAAINHGAFAYVRKLDHVEELLAHVHRAFHRYLADHSEQLRKRLEREILELSEREQRRFGRDLHDGLGQLLTGTALTSKLLAEKLAKQQRPEAKEAERIVDLVNQAIRHTHDLAHSFYPEALESHGLGKALEILVAQVKTTFGIACELQSEIEYDGVALTAAWRCLR